MVDLFPTTNTQNKVWLHFPLFQCLHILKKVENRAKVIEQCRSNELHDSTSH